MDHMASKLVKAGYVDAAIITPTATAQVTIHTEKVGHITSMLGGLGYTNIGTTDDVQENSVSNPNTPITTPAHHDSNTKWIILAAVLGVLLLASVGMIAFFVLRRGRRGKQAYDAVGGKKSAAMAEADVFNAEMHDQEAERLQGMAPDLHLRDSNFESGYDNVNSQYDGSDYDLGASHGDKRAKYGE